MNWETGFKRLTGVLSCTSFVVWVVVGTGFAVAEKDPISVAFGLAYGLAFFAGFWAVYAVSRYVILGLVVYIIQGFRGPDCEQSDNPKDEPKQ